MNEAKKRIDVLKKTINYHRHLYHVENKSEISEQALDSLKDELFKLEQKYPELVTKDSPTQRVSGKVQEGFAKVKHKVAQWSFNDAFSKEDLENWQQRNLNILEKKSFDFKNNLKNDLEYFCELKIDGLKIILEYQNGILEKAATRGDGKVGEDVTENVKTISSVPLVLQKKVSGIFEGEVYISKENFERVNKEQKKNKQELYANPRNLAAGTLRQLDSRIVAERKLDVFIYDIAQIDKDFEVQTQKEEAELLKKLGFVVNQNNSLAKNLKEAMSFYKKQDKKREKYNYWIDGIVLKVNKKEQQKVLGYTGKAPRYAIALKFPAEEKTSVVKDIILQVGRTGLITPVAILDPVSLAGTTVTRSTLHNEDEIKRLDVRVGDTVVVYKAGDIIPKIVKVLKEMRPKDSKPFLFPKRVDGCGGNGEIEKVDGQVAYRCKVLDSEEIRIRRIAHAVSKKAFDIKELGIKNIETFFKKGLISNFYDIYDLEKSDIEVLEGFGEKSAENILKAINEKRKISFERFLISLGISEVGEETAFLLAQEFKTLKNLKKTTKEKLENIEGIGEIMAQNIYDFFNNKHNLDILEHLEQRVKVLKYENEVKTNSYFTNKKVLITGSFDNFSRDEIKKIVKENGGKNVSSISKNTDILIVGENAGSKLKKAKEFGTEILNQKDFENKI